MALGRMPKGTSKLVKRIQGFTSPKKSWAVIDGGELKRMKNSFSQLPEDDRQFFLTGRRSRSVRRHSTFGKLPSDIPQGCLAVYVGMERRRYVISADFLTHTLFKQLLKRSEEEFGFEYEGGLNVACNSAFFEHLLWMIITNDPVARNSHLEDLIDNFEDGSF
ncbi:unnamed protein product [Calypogeia fissa]